MSKKEIVGVFGANGFIGRALVRELLAQGKQVQAFSRSFDDDFANEFADCVDVVLFDLQKVHTFEDALKNVTHVFQLISSSSPGFANDRIIDDIKETIVPHVQFFQACMRSEVEQLIFVSSGGTVYGIPNQRPIPETHICNPRNSYGLSKVILEKYLYMFGATQALNYTIARISNPYGPGQIFKRNQGLIPAIVDRCRNGQPISIYGDGSAIRDYIYITDVTAALAEMIGNEDVYGHILNIGSGSGRSILDVVNTIEKNIDLNVYKEYITDRATDVDVNVLDISKSKKLLNWKPQKNFEDGVRDYLTWAMKSAPPPTPKKET